MTARSSSARTALPEAVLRAALSGAERTDAESRFPEEVFAELRAHGLLGALVPAALGGRGESIGRVAAQCQALAGACASSAMILAMHHIEVACIGRHGGGAERPTDFLRRVAAEQLLIASATSEEGVGGSLRTSRCAVAREGDRFSLVKQASAVSYGRHADAILITARAHPEANESDQVMAILEPGGFALENRGVWDAMGMRGTVTEPCTVTGSGHADQILPVPFGEIAARTMTPISHILWSAVWTGIAGDAVARARAYLRRAHGADTDGPPPGALLLAEAIETLQLAEARLREAIRGFEAADGQTPGFAEAAAYNGLKTSVAEACLAVAQKALTVCGFAGYSRGGPFSVERRVRDLNSAPLMIANGRMREASAWLLLTQAPQLGLDPEPGS